MAKRSLKYNAAVLSVTGFIVKVIGFFYRIFIANSIGSEGLGLYQLVTPIYSLLVLVLAAGVQTAVSRFVAEETSKNTNKGMRIANVSAGMALAAGMVVCSIMLININTLVFTFTGDERTRRSLIYILVLVPPIAAASAYKGYFYGKEEMVPNSVAQILEQVSKLIFVTVLYGSFRGKGVESMCLLAVLAMLFGEIVNVLAVFIVFLIRKSRTKTSYYQGRRSDRWKTAKKIFQVAAPISVNRLILSVIGTAESLIIPRRLVLYGYTMQESLKALGRLSGMAAPLVFFPSMLPGALATALVPAIASAFASKRYYVANRQISQSIKVTLTMGLVFTSFFACCSREIAEFIYPGQEVGKILYIMSFTGVFLYLQQTMLGILNGLSCEKTMLINTLIGSAVRLVLIWFLMPLYGIEAYVFSVIIGSIAVIVLDFRAVIRITGISIDIREWLAKPVVSALAGSFAAVLLKNMFVFLPAASKLRFVFIAGTSFMTIVLAFFLTGVIKREDIMRWTGNSFIR